MTLALNPNFFLQNCPSLVSKPKTHLFVDENIWCIFVGSMQISSHFFRNNCKCLIFFGLCCHSYHFILSAGATSKSNCLQNSSRCDSNILEKKNGSYHHETRKGAFSDSTQHQPLSNVRYSHFHLFASGENYIIVQKLE